MSYYEKARRSSDGRYAVILDKLGYGEAKLEQQLNKKGNAEIHATETSELHRLRDKYKRIFGKKAFHGWDESQIIDKIKKCTINHTGEL